MGIRQIRYCDITGTEDGPDHPVEPHELHIDQMRLDIDLAAGEYQKLLALLRPYIDAGRIEASTPTRTDRRSATTHTNRSVTSRLTAEERDQLEHWAIAHDIPVPPNKRFKRAVIEQWKHELTHQTTA